MSQEQSYPFARKDRLVYEALTNPEAYNAWKAELNAKIEATRKKYPSLHDRIAALANEDEAGQGEAA